MTILDTPEQIEMFRLLQLKHMLALEIKTGLRHSKGSVLKAANDVMLRNGFITTPKRRKQAVLEKLVEYIEQRQKELFP